MPEKNLETPVTNRGVITPNPTSLIATVDWFSCTFKNIQNWKEICGVFMLDSTLFTEQEKGRNGYKKSAVWQSITICYDGTPEMGVFVDLSGQACREYEMTFEKTGFSWQSFFAYLLGFDINITRLDLALDDTMGYFTLKQIENKIKSGCVVSRFRTGRNFEEFLLETGDTLGQTIYFGKSDVMIRFYDKLEEREAKNFALKHEIDFWQRTELQIRKDRAMQACRIISQGGQLGEYICGILRNYISFKIKGTQKQRYKWENCKWWDTFLGSAEKIKLTEVHPYPSILKKKEWIDKQVVSNFATVYEALEDDSLFFDYIVALGKSRMSKAHKELAKEFKGNKFSQAYMREEMRLMLKKLKSEETDLSSLEALDEFWYKHDCKNTLVIEKKQKNHVKKAHQENHGDKIYEPKELAAIVAEIKKVNIGWAIPMESLRNVLKDKPTESMIGYGFSADYVLDCMLDTLKTPVGCVEITQRDNQIYRRR